MLYYSCFFSFLGITFNPTKDKLIAECDDDGTRFDYWVDWETGKVELFDLLPALPLNNSFIT
jgi:hypothetical protein